MKGGHMPKRVIDRFDIEAEREGSAVVRHNRSICKPFGHGKVISKQRRSHSSGEAKIECRTIKTSYERYAHA
jgi:hypothetical protein